MNRWWEPNGMLKAIDNREWLDWNELKFTTLLESCTILGFIMSLTIATLPKQKDVDNDMETFEKILCKNY